MNKIVKYALIGAVAGAFAGYMMVAYAQYTPIPYTVTPYEASPYNYDNSPYNYDNSPYNYNNSPYNYDNSPYNMNSTNRVYDNNGNATGYTTTTPQGVTNYFDFNGNRLGYQPQKGSN
jgi:hypothetical protein